MDYLFAEQILYIHDRLTKGTGGSQGVHDLSALLSAVGLPQGRFEKNDLNQTLFTKAAALIDSLIRNHPFVDGNKRTGMTAGALFLRRNGYVLKAANVDLVKVVLGVAQAQFSPEQIADWLKENTQKLE